MTREKPWTEVLPKKEPEGDQRSIRDPPVAAVVLLKFPFKTAKQGVPTQKQKPPPTIK